MKKTVLCSCILMSFYIQSAVSQIDVEIKNYVDSTELLVKNGRRMLIENIQKNDYQKADEIFEYLSDLSQSLHCRIFGSAEEINISFLLEKWKVYLSGTRKADEYHPNSYRRPVYARYYDDRLLPLCYYISDRLESVTLSAAGEKADLFVSNAMKKNDLTQEEKDFIYLSSSLYSVSIPDYDAKYKDFKKNYPQSEYTQYLKRFLRGPEYKGGMTFDFGVSSFIPDGKLKEYFPQGIAGYFSLDFNWNKLYFSLSAEGGSQKVKKDFKISTHYYTFDFRQGDTFSYSDAGLTVGYMLVRNNWIHIAPTIKVGGGSITSNVFKNADDEYSIYDSFTFAPGLHTEWKVYKLNQKASAFDDELAYLSIKLDGGYNFITNYKYSEARGNMFYARLALVLGIGVF